MCVCIYMYMIGTSLWAFIHNELFNHVLITILRFHPPPSTFLEQILQTQNSFIEIIKDIDQIQHI